MEGRAGLLERLHGEWLEIISTVLLALATVASAWCAYQAARWSGREALRFSESTTARIYAAEADDQADTELAIDVLTFLEFSEAFRTGDEVKADYIETRIFREEMRVAVEAWKATGPLEDPTAPGTPFDMPEYQNASRQEALRLEEEASRLVSEAREAIHNSDFYVLLTVLFAFVLFFAGICVKFRAPGIRIAVLVMGATVFVVALIVLAVQPVA